MLLYSKIKFNLLILLYLVITLSSVNSKSGFPKSGLGQQSARHIRRLGSGGPSQHNLENEENKAILLPGDAGAEASEASQTPAEDRILLLAKKLKILTGLYFLSFYRNPLFRTNINYKQVPKPPTTTPKPYPKPISYEYKKPDKPKYNEESKDNYMKYKPQKPMYEEKYPAKEIPKPPPDQYEKPKYKPSYDEDEPKPKYKPQKYKPSSDEDESKYKSQKYKDKPESEEDESGNDDDEESKYNYKTNSKYKNKKKKKPYKKESEEEEDCVECPSCEEDEDTEDDKKY